MLRNWFRNFMVGRYGQDHLNVALCIGAVVTWILSFIFRGWLWNALYFILLGLAFFRMFSRRIEKRRAENDRFLTFWWPIRRKLEMKVLRLKDNRSYRFFKCPGCHNTLRVPRGKGKVNITCPKCGERFQRKT